MTDDPLWYKDAVIYQLHVKSFFDANDDGVGDFAGLRAKLDYIADLGADAVWLLPFYPSPRRDDGYDISDYRDVHPDYGDLHDAREFVRAAHRRGLRVITELVINHTSDQHPWFQRARAAPPDSPQRNYYVWSDDDRRYADTRIIFLDTEKSNWTWDPTAKAYFWHRFYAHQPDLNFDNKRVLRDVLSVMRFWLDAGVDGLRLDAVPYLIEREDTNNENLPETHGVLKRIRAEVERKYRNRMLLAEANQWPEDTAQYFGDGDECHMAFHFPLMPRMYMAIAQEDRFPITDIMRQTPEIPANCQWAIFLRNHDELTLEMVTDRERDYLWETYANDRRARINLGIRRRLAPLMQRDRRRIELMNGLLFSMPGTPVIYYGDEIGMGDNIYLGDRDGVRTPMQWSPDRNGGFSRANPASLVLPTIMDPVFGFQAVNVEAQAGDPHSLLNWMRRLLAVRRRHQAFGRGAFRLLYPGNRKVLAYLREHEDETILCIFNLSRAPQAVELDLSAYAGRVPIELSGGTAFPPVGQLTYLLTLAPYGFFWFLLAAEARLPSWHNPAPDVLPDLATVVIRRSIDEVLASDARRLLEREALPAYLPKRRWFAAKDAVIERTRLAYVAPIGHDVALAEVETWTGDAASSYLLPLAVCWEAETGGPLPQQLALSRIRRGHRVGVLTDAIAVDAFPNALLEHLVRGRTLSTAAGDVRFRPTTAATPDLLGGGEVRRMSAEQSNTSFILNERVMGKLVRRVRPGVHPEAEMCRHLTEAGYANTPALLGDIVRQGVDGASYTLGVVHAFVRNQGDGWSWTLDLLKRAVDEALLHEPAEPFAAFAPFAAALGRRLAELHAVLARPSDDPAFAPEKAGEQDAARWTERVIHQMNAAIAALERTALPRDLAEQAGWLHTRRPDLEIAVRRAAMGSLGTLRTRIHGDFHLGQTIYVQGDAYLIDFEGEPGKTLEQRRAKDSPLRDVAGLLRSFDYAAGAARADRAGAASGEQERLAALLERFRQGATDGFLAQYRATQATGGAQMEREQENRLLTLFMFEKAAYEVCYEAANRPDWLPLPLAGLHDLAGRLAGAAHA